ncbi:MAG: AAA family ATPase [Tepidisphaeraceae bacterium]
MSVSFSAVLVEPDLSSRRELAQALGAGGIAIAAQVDTVEPLPAVLSRSDAAPPRVVIVNLGSNPREVLRQLSAIARAFPDVSFVVMSSAATAELVMDAMDAGVKAFVPLPLDRARLMAAIERLREGDASERRARVIQFVPTMGGCGATTIACGVAASLAKLGNRTLIVDLDLVRGAVANGFDVRPHHSIADVAGASSQLDRAKLESMLAVHRETGLRVLTRPDAPEDARRVTREGLLHLLDIAGRAFDYLVLDSAMGFDPLHAATTMSADVNVLVAQLTVPSAKNAERCLHALRRMGIDAGTTRVVVNRFVPEATDIQPGEVERALGLKIAWTLPNDFATAMGAINFGEPVTLRSPRTELSKAIVGLAQMLAGRGESGQAVATPDTRYQVRLPT